MRIGDIQWVLSQSYGPTEDVLTLLSTDNDEKKDKENTKTHRNKKDFWNILKSVSLTEDRRGAPGHLREEFLRLYDESA